LTDGTLLLRQINPAFVQNGRVSSQAFRPTPKDQYKLSVYNGDLITAEQSWKHFVAKRLKSVGVLAVNVVECTAEGLPSYSSPEVFEQHAHIDFSNLTEGQIKGKGKRLLAVALVRGWLHHA